MDASHSGLGAVLLQEQGGKERPIAYASRCLRPTERNMTNYSSMKLEFVVLKWAMAEKFREYPLGQKCIVYTGNNPLSHLTSAKLGATEQRWAAQLAAFDFEVRYRSGRCNRNADALSRQNQFCQEMQLFRVSDCYSSSGEAGSGGRTGSVGEPSSCYSIPQFLLGGFEFGTGDPDIGRVLAFWEQGLLPSFAERQLLPKSAMGPSFEKGWCPLSPRVTP